MVINLHICRHSSAQSAVGPPPPVPAEPHSPGWRETEPAWHPALLTGSETLHAHALLLMPCDCKRFLEVLRSRHLEIKQENYKNKPVDFYFKKQTNIKLNIPNSGP